MSTPTTTSAALDRLDFGRPVAGDTDLLSVFEQHCRWEARLCLVCGGPSDLAECTPCAIAEETEAKRREDQ
jgi:hypothetical protein